MQALHLNKSPWAALELQPTPFYSVYLFQVFSAVGNIFWLATDSSHFLREIFIYEIQTMSLNHFICHMCSRQEYCYNVCILVQVCLLVGFFFFLLHQNFITWQSVVYGMLCQSACSSSRTGLPVASIEKERNNNNCKNSVKKETNKQKHNTSQDFTFTLFFKTQIDSQWGIKAQLISYNYITINEFLFWKWWQQKDRGLINSARLVR